MLNYGYLSLASSTDQPLVLADRLSGITKERHATNDPAWLYQLCSLGPSCVRCRILAPSAKLAPNQGNEPNLGKTA